MRISVSRCRALVSLTLAFWLAAISPAQTPAASADVIHVDVLGFRSDKGQVLCALYASANGFPTKPDLAIARTKSTIVNRTSVCEFPNVVPGKYAVSVVHDENANGKMDTNFIGMPKEGVGSSNDAKGHMGPPKFDAAAFQFTGGRLELKINLFYL